MKFKFRWCDVGFFACIILALYFAYFNNPQDTMALVGSILFLYYRMGLIEGRLDTFERRLDTFEKCLGILEKRFDALEERFDLLEKRLPGEIGKIIREELKKA
jgi:hypothetical protein